MVAPLALMGMSVAADIVGGVADAIGSIGKTASPAQAGKDKLKKTAQDFESVFLEQTLDRLTASGGQEGPLGTNPNDGDTDNDGLSDGYEVLTSLTLPLNKDTDGDGVQDGTELGLVTAQSPGTDLSVFVPDADSATKTNPKVADTDSGLAPDGDEDKNHDGKVDTGECDPLNPADDGKCRDGADGCDTAERAACAHTILH